MLTATARPATDADRAALVAREVHALAVDGVVSGWAVDAWADTVAVDSVLTTVRDVGPVAEGQRRRTAANVDLWCIVVDEFDAQVFWATSREVCELAAARFAHASLGLDVLTEDGRQVLHPATSR